MKNVLGNYSPVVRISSCEVCQVVGRRFNFSLNVPRSVVPLPTVPDTAKTLIFYESFLRVSFWNIFCRSGKFNTGEISLGTQPRDGLKPKDPVNYLNFIGTLLLLA